MPAFQTIQQVLASKVAGLEEGLNINSSNLPLSPSSDLFTKKKTKKKFVERMMTTATTCKLQDRNGYNYITAGVVAHLKDEFAIACRIEI